MIERYEVFEEAALEYINSLIKRYVEISLDEWELCRRKIECQFFPKGSMLINQQDVCRKIFLVAKGLLRTYYTNEKGIEKTVYFALENSFAMDYMSFLYGSPAKYSIEALEDTVVLVLSYEDATELCSSLRYGEKFARLVVADSFAVVEGFMRDMCTLSPLERYEAMSERFPNINQRVAQYHIASYLNISSVHLSRLKITRREYLKKRKKQ